MTTTSSTSYPHWPVPARIVRARWKLFLSVVISFVAFIFLPHDWGLVTRVLISWDIGVALYILVALWTIHYSDATHIPRQSLLQDDLRHIITPLTVIAALVILPFIFIELRTPPGGAERDTWDIVLGVLTILLSWAFIHTILAFHYAHEYYSEHRNRKECLEFPGDPAPDYRDFVYFSFVIGMTSQVSDVQVKSKSMRKTVILHSLASFIFNVTLLALAVNIAASAI
jgi:uncharacterized membrane protein